MFVLKFTELAEDDLISILKYITEILKAPLAAKNLLVEIEDQTKLLKTNPFSYALVFDEYLYSKGIRSILVKNYNIFYIVKEEEQIVSILRILYARRDWNQLLRTDFIPED